MAMQAELWTVSGLSVETGITRRAVAKALTTCPVAGKKRGANCYWMRDAGPLLYGNESHGIDLVAQKARYHKEMADKLERENEEQRRDLVATSEVAALWESLTTEVRSVLLAIPARAAREIAEPTEYAEVKNMIEAEINDALTPLSEDRKGLPKRK